MRTYTLRIVEPRPLSFDRPQTSTAVSDTLWLVAGQAGQVVNLTISPSPDDMTPRLSLMDASGQNVASGVVSPAEGYERIPAAILPNDGRLLVQVGPTGDRTPYTLTLTTVEPRPLAFDRPATSTTRADPLWTFTGAAGQIVDIALDSAQPAAFDPQLRLLDAGGNEIAADYDSGDDLNARIAAFILPAEGRYFVQPLPADRPTSYTLTLRQVTPRPIALGETASSTLDETVLWAFDGAAGQPIKVAVDAASGESASVALWSETGRLLTSGGEYPRDAASNTIDGYILPAAGRYLVRIGGLSPSTRYDLAVAEARTRAIQPGAVVTSTTISDTLWTMDLAAGQALDIAMTTTDSELRSLPDRVRRQRRQPGQRRRQRRQQGCPHQPVHSAGGRALCGACWPAGQRSALHAGGARRAAAGHRAGRNPIVQHAYGRPLAVQRAGRPGDRHRPDGLGAGRQF
ncbi:MAG: hypothetical protein V9H69_01115 [Anaerolineae bacterium]